MDVSFGKHSGRSVGWLLLNDPGYVRWIFQQTRPGKQMQPVIDEVRRLVGIFNGKPFVEKCSGECGRPATRCTVHGSTTTLMAWCDQCDPYSRGAAPGKLRVIRTYQEAVDHGLSFGNAAISRELVRELAIAKGLRAPVTELHINKFFAAGSDSHGRAACVGAGSA